MRFTHITLENWRNFGHVDVPLQNHAYLIGPNASGKSNFLDVFRFLHDLATSGGGFQKAVLDRGGVPNIRNLAARRSPDVAVQVALGEDEQTAWVYRLAFAEGDQGLPVLTEETVWRGDGLILSRPDDDDMADPVRLRQTWLEQTFANREFRAIADFFGSVRYSHIVPQLVRDPDRYIRREADPYGGDFVEQIVATEKLTRELRLRSIQDILKILIAQFAGLKLRKDRQGVFHLYGHFQHWRTKRLSQREADLSDGTLCLIGLLWAMQDGTGPLLLDDPELSLDAQVVSTIPRLLRNARQQKGDPSRQSLVSTHSNILLEDGDITTDDVLVLYPSPEGTEVKIGSEVRADPDIVEA